MLYRPPLRRGFARQTGPWPGLVETFQHRVVVVIHHLRTQGRTVVAQPQSAVPHGVVQFPIFLGVIGDGGAAFSDGFDVVIHLSVGSREQLFLVYVVEALG